MAGRIIHADGTPDETNSPVAPAARGTRKLYQDYFGGERDAEPDIPLAGDQIWFRLRLDGRWVPAVVLDPISEGLDEPTGTRLLHLAVDMSHLYRTLTGDGSDPDRRLAASRVGFRMNVVEGAEPGEWQRQCPPDADRVYEQEQARRESETAMRRQMAVEGGLTATHRGRLPHGVR